MTFYRSKYNPLIKIEDYEFLDPQEKSSGNRYGFHWTIQEEFMLTERWLTLKPDIHAIAKLHKRSFKSICLKLEQIKLVNKKFDRDFIETNNRRYLIGSTREGFTLIS